MATWVELTAADIASGKPLPYTLFDKFADRDEALVDQPFRVEFAEVSQSGNTYPTFGAALVTRRIWVPASAKTLRITLKLKAGAGTAYVRGTMQGINSDEQSTTSTTYVERTITWTDLSSLRSTIGSLTLHVSNSASGNTSFLLSDDLIAARWGFD